MNIKQTEKAYLCRLFALVSVLTVCGHFLDQVVSGSWGAKGLFLFIFSFHMPLLITLSGMIYGRVERDGRQAERIGAYSLCIYLVSKTLVSLARLPFTGKFTFLLFTESGAPWIFFTIAVFFLVSGSLKKVNKNALLIISLALSLASGFIPGIGDFLVLSRTLVFFPYFVMGWMFSQRCWEETADSARARMAGTGVLLLALAGFLIFAKGAYPLRQFFTAHASYEAILEERYAYGPLFRSASYVIGIVLTAAALMAVPAKGAGKLTVRLGESFTAIYVLHRPLLYILMGLEANDALKHALGPAWGSVAWMLCALICLAVLSWKPLNRPFAALFKALTSDEGLGTDFDEQFDRLEGGRSRADVRKRRLMYLGVYTIAFFAAFLIAYDPFMGAGKTFIWNGDGRQQHYPMLIYLGRCLRRGVLNFLHGDFEIPMYDISLGLGSDIVGYLNAWGLNDPLILLAFFFPTHSIEGLYGFLTIFRVYLAGLCFSYCCRYFGKSARYTLIGSIVYCFSGYALYYSMRHPYFITPMIQLPLLIAGLEKIMRRERPYLFIAAVFYSVLSEYYHLYMLTIMLAVYGIARFFDLYKSDRIKEFFKFVGRVVVGYGLGLGLSAIVFLPSVFVFLNGHGTDSSNYIRTNYTTQYFTNHLLQLFAPANTEESVTTLAAIVLLALTVLICAKGKRTLKIVTVVAFATWLTGFGNLVMNGFQYPSTRWTFGLAFLAAFCVVEMLPELLSLKGRSLFACVIVACIYAVNSLFYADGRKLRGTVGLCFLAAMLLCFTIGGDADEHAICAGEKRSKRLRTLICLSLVILNAGVNGIYIFAADQGNYSAQFSKMGYETERLENGVELAFMPFLSNDPDGRGDSSLITRNTAMVWHIPGMLSFNHVENKNVVNFWDAINSSVNSNLFTFTSTDQRTIVNTLLSEKYHIETKDRRKYVPYGYTQVGETENGYFVFENQYALPWGYTYDNEISYQDLEDLNGLQRQEVMLQAIALDGAPSDTQSFDLDEQMIPYEVECSSCKMENGALEVSKGGATITLKFSMPAGVEGYVRLKGLDINGSGQKSFTLKLVCDGVSKTSKVTSNLYNWYYGRENYLFNLGYSDEARSELTITFPTKGDFKLADIELYALPMDNYPERVEALRAEPLENIQWGTNSLTGTVDLSKDKILCVSVPYSKGWSATVDGEQVEILRGNYMFMCLPLTAGHHDIAFRYCSPGIKLGAAVTVCSAGILIWMLVRDKKKKEVKTDGV